MGIRFINNGKGGGQASSVPNIFVQENEPTIKKGIWLQTNKELEHIYGDDDIFIAGKWKPYSEYRDIPYDFYSGSAVAIGTDIYLFGGALASKYCYKYDTILDSYIRLSNIPYDFVSGSAVAIGTDIYLFGGNSTSTSTSTSSIAYKYNVLTNTFTQLSNIPYSFNEGSAVAVGKNVYLFGSNNSSYYQYTYKYDTLTDTYSQLSNIPYSFYGGSVAAIGNNVYLLGGSGNNKYAYKYSILDNKYTKLTNIPYPFVSGSAVAIGTDIYLFGSSESSYEYTGYKYNTLNKQYTRISIPFYFYKGSMTIVGTNIYLLGSHANQKALKVYALESSTYENNSVVLAQGRFYQSGYGIELYNDNLFSSPMLYAFADAWFYTTENGIITDIPTYYGNGTEWIKFKN